VSAPWFKCYPRDFNEGMVGLTLEERGAYITLLNLIYARGGPIPEDPWWITSQLGCTSRMWVKVRASLLVKRKIYALEIEGEPYLMNTRAAEEIAEREKLSRTFSEAGRNGGRKSKPKANKNNGNSEAWLKPGSSLTEAISDTDTEGSVVPTDVETTGGEPPNVDPDAKAWADAKALLVGQAGISIDAAGKFFGKLLATHGVQARDMLGAINEGFANRTADPQGWLTGAARARARGRGPPAQAKRVGWV
jgi:uncharacterized protein YdaU (DUF1376 family)